MRSKAYGDAPLNVNEDVWRQVLDLDKGKERDLDLEDEDSQYDEEEEEWEGGEREFVEDDSEEESVGDLEDYSGSEVSFALFVFKFHLTPSLRSSTQTRASRVRSSRQTSKSPTTRRETRTARKDRTARPRRREARVSRAPLGPMARPRVLLPVPSERHRPATRRRGARDVSGGGEVVSSSER